MIPAEKLGNNFERLRDAILGNRPTPIFFIGVWDTVGALGIPLGWARWIGKSKYDFHDTDLSERIRYAYHALAIDERRKSFTPALWTRPKGRGQQQGVTKQTLEQVWFAGAHSNVGGGYEDQGLSDIAFLWMIEKARVATWTNDKGLPLAFDETYLKSKTAKMQDLLYDSSEGLVWTMAGPRGPRDHGAAAERPADRRREGNLRVRSTGPRASAFECTNDQLFTAVSLQAGQPRSRAQAIGLLDRTALDSGAGIPPVATALRQPSQPDVQFCLIPVTQHSSGAAARAATGSSAGKCRRSCCRPRRSSDCRRCRHSGSGAGIFLDQLIVVRGPVEALLIDLVVLRNGCRSERDSDHSKGKADPAHHGLVLWLSHATIHRAAPGGKVSWLTLQDRKRCTTAQPASSKMASTSTTMPSR